MDKLKPCPFCGNEVYVEKKPLWQGSHGYFGCYEYDIRCHNCGCKIKLPSNDTVYNSDHTAQQNAIKAWNRRADNLQEVE